MMRHIFMMLFAAIALASCETISEKDRFQPVNELESKKIVLLEEFTGVRCTNCPKAAKIAHDLLEMFPKNVVVIGLHGTNTGSFGKPFEGEQDFRVAGVEEIFEAMGGTSAQGYPCGMINRLDFGGKIFLNSDTWVANAFNELMEKEQAFNIVIENDEEATVAENEMKVNVSVETIKMPEGGDFSLVVQVIEDGIVGSQVDGGETKKDYVHNHVLRSFVNGTWGDPISVSAEGGRITNSYTITFDNLWVKDNCSIVAYVYDSKTKRNIHQAVILHLSGNTNH